MHFTHPPSALSVAKGCKKLAACFRLFRDRCKSASVAFCWLDVLPRQTDPQLIHGTRHYDADFWKWPLILPAQARLNWDTPPLTKSCPVGRWREGKWIACVYIYVCPYLYMHAHTCVILDSQHNVSQAPSRKMPNSLRRWFHLTGSLTRVLLCKNLALSKEFCGRFLMFSQVGYSRNWSGMILRQVSYVKCCSYKTFLIYLFIF